MTRPHGLAVAATFSPEPLCAVLSVYRSIFGDSPAEPVRAGNLVGLLLDAEGTLRSSPERVVAVRLADLVPQHGSARSWQTVAEELAVALVDAASQGALVVLLTSRAERIPTETAAERWLLRTLRGDPRLVTIDATTAPPDAFDPSSDALAQIPYSPLFFANLGGSVARALYAIKVPPPKLLAVDGDHTLWGGIIAEDGVQGITFDGPRLALGQALLAARARGVLLALVTKNDERDVMEALSAHPESPLQFRDFAVVEAGWGTKADALREAANTLGFGLDRVVMLDDNPLEIAALRAALPEVTSVRWPAEDAEASLVLANLWPLDVRPTTGEDRRRADMQTAIFNYRAAASSTPDLSAFHATLGLTVVIRPPGTEDVARIAQLTQRVTQMNATGLVLRPADLAARLSDASCINWVVHVSDRFGDLGLCGAILGHDDGACLRLQAMVLSCRALGRGVEHMMLRRLGEEAHRRSYTQVLAMVTETPRNAPFRDLLGPLLVAQPQPGSVQPPGSAAAQPQPGSDGSVALAARDLMNLNFNPGASGAAAPAAKATAAAPPSHPNTSAVALAFIAETLNTPTRVARAVLESKAPSVSDAPYVAPATDDERALARIWEDVLGVTPISTNAGFFALGGDSLAAVRVTSRVRDTLGLPLAPTALFDGPTIAHLATRLEAIRAGSEADRSLVELVGALSHDEVAERLRELHGETSAQPSIDTIAYVTKDRPELLRRAITSYLLATQGSGQRVEILVLDDSGPAAESANRAWLTSLSQTSGVPVRHLGRAAKLNLGRRLARRAGVPLPLIELALDPPPAGSMLVGANRNALLLAAAGRRALSVDDDTLALGQRASAMPSVRSYPGLDPATIEALPTSPDLPTSLEWDLLGELSAPLGRTVRELAAQGALSLVDRPDARARIVAPGLLGDCGWGAPFGLWYAPMGYLTLRDDARGALVEDLDLYAVKTRSRMIRRVVPRLTLTDASFGMTTFLALDLTSMLPPVFPSARGTDVIFVGSAFAIDSGLAIAHIPATLFHAPHPPRHFWPGEMTRTAAGIDTSRVLAEVLRHTSFRDGGPSARIGTLARSFRDLASGARLRDMLTTALDASSDRLLRFLGEQAAGYGPTPDVWVRDVEAYADRLRAARRSPEYGIPLDLAHLAAPSQGLAHLASLFGPFGDLLDAWPALFQAALDEARDPGSEAP